MKLLRLKLVDIGALGERAFDLSAMPGGDMGGGPALIGIIGPNGTGKSTTMEAACPGAMFRKMTSRDPSTLYEVAKSRNACIDAVYRRGAQEFRFLLLIDGEKRKMESHIYCDGQPYSDGSVVSNGRTTVFDQLVASLVGTWDMVAATRFWAQKGKGLIGNADTGTTRSLFRELLRLDEYETLAKGARARHAKLVEQIDANRTALQAEQARSDDFVSWSQRHGAAKAALDNARDALASSKEQKRAVDAQLAEARVAMRASSAAEQIAQRAKLSDRVADLRAERVPLAAAVGLHAGELAEKRAKLEEVERQWAVATQHNARRDGLVGQQQQLERDYEATKEAAGAERPDLAALAADVTRLEAEVQALAQTSARLEEAKRNLARLEEDLNIARKEAGAERPDLAVLEADVARLEAEGKSLEAEVARYDGLVREAGEVRRRLDGMRSQAEPLATVPCGGEGKFASCRLIESAVTARDGLGEVQAALDQLTASIEVGAPKQRLADVHSSLTVARAAHTSAHIRILAWADVDRMVKRQVELSLAMTGLVAQCPPGALATSREVLAKSRTALGLGEACARAWADADKIRSRLIALEMEIPDAKPVPDKAAATEAKAVAERANAQASSELAKLDGELRGVERQLEAMPSLSELDAAALTAGWTGLPVSELESRCNVLGEQIATQASLEAEASREEAHSAAMASSLSDAPQKLATLKDASQELAGLQEDLSALVVAFGSRGIQADLVHAAGPAVAAFATDLLDVAYGERRFTVELQTLAEKLSGEGMKDAMDLIVHDSKTGWSGPISNLSGGESDIVNSAVGLAVAAHDSEVNGVAWQTGFADEAGSACTEEMAVQWVLMLRTAAERLGIEQVLIVTHDAAVQRMLDGAFTFSADGSVAC